MGERRLNSLCSDKLHEGLEGLEIQKMVSGRFALTNDGQLFEHCSETDTWSRIDIEEVNVLHDHSNIINIQFD